MNKRTFSIREMTLIAVMAALTFAASQLSINIPTALSNTRLHLGNALCLLSGMLLGPVSGGLAAGIGSMFFDFTNPLYFASAPFTLVFKFLMAFVCGLIVRRDRGMGSPTGTVINRFVAGLCGALTYVVLYLGKNFIYNIYFLRTQLETALVDLSVKGAVSAVNGAMAVIVSVALYFPLRSGLSAIQKTK